MAEVAVSLAVAAFGNSLIRDAGEFLCWTMQLHVEELAEELRRMLSFLKDADARAVDDDSIRIWVSDIRDIAYDTEDLLERYISEVGSSRNGSFVGAINRCVCLWNGWYFHHKVGSEMQALKTKIQDLNHRLQEYQIRTIMEEGGSSRFRQQWLPHSFVVEEDIIGLERDVDMLVQLLVSEDEHRVVSICGMAGSGKTTLARRVYNHSTVRRYFAGLAWICVSQEWRARDILEQVITHLDPGKRATIRSLRENDLVKEIYTILEQNRCLVVLDDIWTPDVWECIRPAFPIDQGSKILVTTRFRDLVFRMDPNGFLYQPRFLSEDESWELFQKRALRGIDVGGDMERDFEMLGKEIVKFCGGLPLALVVVAGILSDKSSLEEWKIVYRNLQDNISRDASYFGSGSALWILAQSYNHLPAQLKLCFLYLGSFPEDTNIKAETLYQLWIAEGLVENQREEVSMMDLAEIYLGELAERAMVQVQTSDVPKIRRFESCCLPDITRDFCLLKAKEENFLKYISSEDIDVEQVYSTTVSSTNKLRRLVIDSYNKSIHRNFPAKKEMTKHLRMLRLLVPNSSVGREAMTIGFQFNNTPMLRVLSIEGFRPVDVWKLPKAIGKLILLKYLSLKDSSIVSLPSSLTNLKHLQTLDLRVFKLGRLPNILRKIIGLRYLYLPSFDKLGGQPNKIRLDGLSKLEILENFSDQLCDINDLLQLANLQVLAVHCFELENLATIANHACTNNRLEHVSISTDCDFRSNMEKGLTILQQSLFGNKIHCFRSEGAIIPQFPEPESPITSPISSSLVQLSMNLKGLKEDNVMGTLEKLENLRILFLRRFDGKEMTFHAGGFPQLRTLKLFSFLNLKKWVVEETAVPNLCTLSIWGFTVLDKLPDGLQFVATLKELDIRLMPEKFRARIKTRDGGKGEDFYKIRHVPLVLSSSI